jgi:hypothetical protein
MQLRIVGPNKGDKESHKSRLDGDLVSGTLLNTTTKFPIPPGRTYLTA